MQINDTTIEETLDELLIMMEDNIDIFYKSYKSIPFELYSEIERLSVSKSSLQEELCNKARKVAETFHKSIK
jgi:hypothetical protein